MLAVDLQGDHFDQINTEYTTNHPLQMRITDGFKVTKGILCTNLELGLGIAGVALDRSPFLAAILCNPVDCDDFTIEEEFLMSSLAR